MNLNTISSTYFAPKLIILGTIGNLLGLIVISRKKLATIGQQIIYIALFTFVSINLALIFQPYVQFAFNIDVTSFSLFGCESYWYVNYAMGPISPMLTVYISIERYISMYSLLKRINNSKKNNKCRLVY